MTEGAGATDDGPPDGTPAAPHPSRVPERRDRRRAGDRYAGLARAAAAGEEPEGQAAGPSKNSDRAGFGAIFKSIRARILAWWLSCAADLTEPMPPRPKRPGQRQGYAWFSDWDLR